MKEEQHDHPEENDAGDAESARNDAGQNIDRDGEIEKAADEIGDEQQHEAAHGVDEQFEDLLDGRGDDFDQHVDRDDDRRGEKDGIKHFHIDHLTKVS